MRLLARAETSAWLVNEELVFRFPHDEQRGAKVEVEARVLEALPGAVRAPTVEWISPRGYSGQRYLHGRSGEERRPPRAAWAALARDVADALTVLHRTPPPAGVPEARLPRPEVLLERAQRDAPLAHVDPELLGEPPAVYGEPVLCHGDLKGEHFVLDADDRLAGIVDWADACVSHPVRDLAGLVIWLGPAFARLVDEEHAAAATFYGRCFAVVNVARAERGLWDAPPVYDQLRAAFGQETV